MSRYYDTVTHRFVNSDGYFTTGLNPLDANMNIYCRNNPVNCFDPMGTITSKQMQENLASAYPIYTLEQIIRQAMIENVDVIQRYPILSSEHRKNKNKSNLERHQYGRARHNRDANKTEKGDKRRKEDRSNKRRKEQIVPTPKDAILLKDIEDLPTVEFEWSFPVCVPDTGDKPIYEKVWDEIVHMFD